MKRAVLLVGHGSKFPQSDRSMAQVLNSLRDREPDTYFLNVFLGTEHPSILEGIVQCVEQGAQEIVVAPYFVHAGKHVSEGIPAIIAVAKARHPDRVIALAEYLNFDERVAGAVYDRIQRARTSVCDLL